MKLTRRQRAALAAWTLLFIAMDAALTVIGQPEAYWQDRTQHNELSPLFAAFIERSMAMFMAAAAVYALIVLLAILALPAYWSLGTSVAFTIGHASAAKAWMLHGLGLGYWVNAWFIPMVAFAVISMCATVMSPPRQAHVADAEEAGKQSPGPGA